MSRIGRIAGRVMQQLHLIGKGHIMNPFWYGRVARRKRRYKATYDAAIGYLRRYAPAVERIVPESTDSRKEPERAFTIWLQGENQAPELVKACFRSMRRNLTQELVVLDETTLYDWITLPEHIVAKWKEGKIPHAHFSDICRIELLYKHGGLWFDATDYVTAPVPQYIMDQDLFLFMAGNKIRGSYSFIQNCFMRARKGNPVFGVWREAINIYWKEENSKINYFVHHLLLKLSVDVNATARLNFDKMPRVEQDPTHALWGEHCNDDYNETKFAELTSGAFFQKTNYKDSRLRNLKPGSIAEYILKS